MVCLRHSLLAAAGHTALSSRMDSRASASVRFYTNKTGVQVEEDNVTRVEWDSESGWGNLDLSMGDPSLTYLDLTGRLPGSGFFSSDFDTQFVVLDGSCKIELGEVTQDLIKGETFWVRAGFGHAITAAGNVSKMLAVGGPWHARAAHDEPTYNVYEDSQAQGPKDTDFYNNSAYRAFLQSDHPWEGDEVQMKEWKHSSENRDDPALFSVKLSPGHFIGAHHHPTGALYIILDGAMNFVGEGKASALEFRWTAPGHWYGGEAADEVLGAYVVVLGTDVEPQFVPASPADNYLAEHRRNMHRVYRGMNTSASQRTAVVV